MAYHYEHTNNCNEQTIVDVRNVLPRNPENALQFEIQQDRGKHRKLWSFSLPASEICSFLATITRTD